jgi:hypothetical protein
MDADEIERAAEAFAVLLETKRRECEPLDFDWYPWRIIGSFGQILDQLLGPKNGNRKILDLAAGNPVADIGAADGDFGFFLESLGCEVDIIDHAATNGNRLRGAHALKAALHSAANIYDIDLDARFELPRRYGLAFFLGTLYHLKSPYYALESLAQQARYCVLSTKTATLASARAGLGRSRDVRIAEMPVAWLLRERELNNDPTNFWVFSHGGLERILERAGWTVLERTVAGNRNRAYPDRDPEERTWCLLQSKAWSS